MEIHFLYLLPFLAILAAVVLGLVLARADLDGAVPCPAAIGRPLSFLRSQAARFFASRTCMLCAALCIFALTAVLRLDAAQSVVLGLGEALKGRPLNREVWHARFEGWGLAVLANPAVIFFFIHVLRSFFLPECEKPFDRAFLCIVFVLWAGYTGYTAMRHEPWMDELFVYVKARDMGIRELLGDVRVDGNFALWSLFISLFAKAGLPVEVITCISFALSALLLLLFFVKSPFSVYEKAAFAFTTAVSYHYPVVARPYVLFALLTFLLAAVWKRRTEHPRLVGSMIALLSHTHLYAEGFVAILILYIFVTDILLPWETLEKAARRRRLAGLSIACLGVALAAVLVVPACWTSSGIVLAQVGRANLNLKGFFSNWIWEPLATGILPVMLLLLAAMVRLFWESRRMFIIFAASFAYMILFHIFIYNASVPNRGSMWLFILVFAFWNANERPSAVNPFLLLVCLIAINPSWNVRDWTMEYSGEKRLGEYIEKNVPKEEPVYMTGTDLVTAYVPGHNIRIFAPLSVTAEELDRRIGDFFEEDSSGSFILVLSKLKVGGFAYPRSYRSEILYESSEIMAQLYQFSVLRVWRDSPD